MRFRKPSSSEVHAESSHPGVESRVSRDRFEDIRTSGTLVSPTRVWIISILVFLALSMLPLRGNAEEKMAFWKTQKMGINAPSQPPKEEWWKAAKEVGAQFVRLAPDAWSGDGRDFLLGSANEYRGLIMEDLTVLRRQLDLAQAQGLKVVLVMRSLPGCRRPLGKQELSDRRLWQEHRFWAQAATFWRELARGCAGHPALVGYDVLHEPHPSRILLHTHVADAVMKLSWDTKIWGSLGDINHLYKVLAASIRQVDPETPIILESDLFAAPGAFAIVVPLPDPKILYSFHFHEPREFTSGALNRGRFAYPAKMPAADGKGCINWDRRTFRQRLKPVIKWSQVHEIPAVRILVGEFGCDRESIGSGEFLADAVVVFNALGYHWACSSDRADDKKILDAKAWKDAFSDPHKPARGPR
ncbi:MAG: cellulase family glycosylhydrolase [Candidatus Ozemobacteraceae bacterium]